MRHRSDIQKCRIDIWSKFTRMSFLYGHDDVIRWKHFPRYWPFVRGIHRSPVNSQHKGQWRGALMFSLICTWINGWVNNCEASDLRRHRAHYDVTIMVYSVEVATCTGTLFFKKLKQNEDWPILALRLGYSRRNRSIARLLTPWHLASPCHQQTWYWLCKIKKNKSATICLHHFTLDSPVAVTQYQPLLPASSMYGMNRSPCGTPCPSTPAGVADGAARPDRFRLRPPGALCEIWPQQPAPLSGRRQQASRDHVGSA